MKALSLLQPYASLIAVGAKKIETRSWSTKYRGPLAIHASKKWTLEQSSKLCFSNFQTGLSPLVGIPLNLSSEITWGGVQEKHIILGCVIATCELVDCIPTDILTQKQIGTDRPFGDFNLGRYAWILENVKPLEAPIPAKGALSLWEWEDTV